MWFSLVNDTLGLNDTANPSTINCSLEEICGFDGEDTSSNAWVSASYGMKTGFDNGVPNQWFRWVYRCFWRGPYSFSIRFFTPVFIREATKNFTRQVLMYPIRCRLYTYHSKSPWTTDNECSSACPTVPKYYWLILSLGWEGNGIGRLFLALLCSRYIWVWTTLEYSDANWRIGHPVTF